jgi:hypothetical protein
MQGRNEDPSGSTCKDLLTNSVSRLTVIYILVREILLQAHLYTYWLELMVDLWRRLAKSKFPNQRDYWNRHWL